MTGSRMCMEFAAAGHVRKKRKQKKCLRPAAATCWSHGLFFGKQRYCYSCEAMATSRTREEHECTEALHPFLYLDDYVDRVSSLLYCLKVRNSHLPSVAPSLKSESFELASIALAAAKVWLPRSALATAKVWLGTCQDRSWQLPRLILAVAKIDLGGCQGTSTITIS
jgi:hypothetical protein